MREGVPIYRLLFKTRQLVRVFRQAVSDPIKISAPGGRDIPVGQLFDPRFAKRLEGLYKAQKSVSHEIVSRGKATKARCNSATICGGKPLQYGIAASPKLLFCGLRNMCESEFSLWTKPHIETFGGVFPAQTRAI